MRIRPLARIGSRKSTQGRLPMIATEPADPLTIVLDRRIRTAPAAPAATIVIWPARGKGRDPLLGPPRRALLLGEHLALDLARLTQARWQLETQRADLGLRDVALARRPRVVDLDDRPPVLDPHTHAELRCSCQFSHAERR